MVITGSDKKGILEFKQFLHNSFHMKDLGTLTYFLGLEVSYSSHGLFLTQCKYIEDLIKLANLTDNKVCSTPMKLNLKLQRDDDTLISDPTLYQRLVGSLIYLTITRPDISFVVQVVSQFVSQPRHHHLSALHQIICYLKGTSDRGIFFPSHTTLTLKAFSDADYVGFIDTRRSTAGWCVFLGTSLISWKSKKQERVSKSSIEVEYRSLSSVSSELVWLRRLLLDVPCDDSIHLLVIIQVLLAFPLILSIMNIPNT